jgi:NAD-dependent dihydropyrimidine dehydrogenase PreA subunit
MTYVIAQPCVGVKDGACVAVCPCDCIRPTPQEEDFARFEQLFIDPEHCIDCGLCVLECPVNAIFHELELPSQWSSFLEKNAAHFSRASER